MDWVIYDQDFLLKVILCAMTFIVNIYAFIRQHPYTETIQLLLSQATVVHIGFDILGIATVFMKRQNNVQFDTVFVIFMALKFSYLVANTFISLDLLCALHRMSAKRGLQSLTPGTVQLACSATWVGSLAGFLAIILLPRYRHKVCPYLVDVQFYLESGFAACSSLVLVTLVLSIKTWLNSDRLSRLRTRDNCHEGPARSLTILYIILLTSYVLLIILPSIAYRFHATKYNNEERLTQVYFLMIEAGFVINCITCAKQSTFPSTGPEASRPEVVAV